MNLGRMLGSGLDNQIFGAKLEASFSISVDGRFFQTDVCSGPHPPASSYRTHMLSRWGGRAALVPIGIRLGTNSVDPIFYDTQSHTKGKPRLRGGWCHPRYHLPLTSPTSSHTDSSTFSYPVASPPPLSKLAIDNQFLLGRRPCSVELCWRRWRRVGIVECLKQPVWILLT